MPFQFEKYERDTPRHHQPVHTYDGIRLAKPGIFLCRSVRARLGDSRVSVFFDTNAQYLLLKPDPEDYRISKGNHGTGIICAKRLSNTMPLGLYLYTQDYDGGYLFTYEQQ